MHIIDSPAYRRHMRCRHALTLDLFTRTGDFWAHVADMRAKWGITVEEAIPPPLFGEYANNPWESPESLHYPKKWPLKPFDWLLADPLEVPSDPVLREGYEYVWRGTWWEDISALATVDTPAECRGDGLFRADPFVPFFAACVLYDPPRDALLDFAEAGRTVVTMPPIAHADLIGAIEPALIPVGMFQPPIVGRQDPGVVRTVVIDWYEALFDAIATRIREKGLDLHAIRRSVQAIPEFSRERLRDDLRQIPNEHYIQVRPETGREEVLGAYQLIRARYPGPPSKKHERTDLECVQVALWRAGGRSEEEVAHHFGWKPKSPDAGMPRSKNVRDYAKRGRAVLEARGISVPAGDRHFSGEPKRSPTGQ